IESLMPLRLARYGVPLAETAPAGLSAAGIEPQLLPALPARPTTPQAQARPVDHAQPVEPAQYDEPVAPAEEGPGQWFATPPHYEPPAYDVPVGERGPGPVSDAVLQPQQLQVPEPRVAEPDEAGPTGIQAQQPEPQASEPDGEGTPSEDDHVSGRPAVEAMLKSLSDEDRDRSANSLARELAPELGLTEGTVRKYIGEIRRRRARAAP
ncbi:hypothetical protein K7472_31955, partial [Streptomyces sp. PTM05]|nr:hypothetical protein [Streptantibioticus parmotrematis]